MARTTTTHVMIPIDLLIHRNPTSFERPDSYRSGDYLYGGKSYEYGVRGSRFLVDMPGEASISFDLDEILIEGLRALGLEVKDPPGARPESPVQGAWEVRVERKTADDGEDVIVVNTHTMHPESVLTERTAINLVTNLLRAVKQIQGTDHGPEETAKLVLP